MDKEYTIHIEETGETFPCKEHEILLDAIRNNGTSMSKKGCFGGGCGVCKVRIVSGNYHKVKNMSRAHVSIEEETKGLVLSCCITPRSDLTITDKQ